MTSVTTVTYAGANPSWLSGRLTDVAAATAAYERIKSLVAPLTPMLLEPHLQGAEVFAETIVSRGAVMRVSFRALKLPLPPNASEAEGVAVWQWPAVLSPTQKQACELVVLDACAALDLRNGVFGLQLVLDEATEGGCALLEVNLRPHMWPTLFEPAIQVRCPCGETAKRPRASTVNARVLFEPATRARERPPYYYLYWRHTTHDARCKIHVTRHASHAIVHSTRPRSRRSHDGYMVVT